MIILGQENISHSVYLLNMTQCNSCTVFQSEYPHVHIRTQSQTKFF